jgi:hypothetical protein
MNPAGQVNHAIQPLPRAAPSRAVRNGKVSESRKINITGFHVLVKGNPITVRACGPV